MFIVIFTNGIPIKLKCYVIIQGDINNNIIILSSDFNINHNNFDSTMLIYYKCIILYVGFKEI